MARLVSTCRGRTTADYANLEVVLGDLVAGVGLVDPNLVGKMLQASAWYRQQVTG